MLTTAVHPTPHYVVARIGAAWAVMRLSTSYGPEVLGPAATYLPVGLEYQSENEALAEAARRNLGG